MKIKNRETIFFLSFIPLLFMLINCHSSSKEEVLLLDQNSQKQASFPYRPTQINISYTKDSIFITKIFKSGEKQKYQLYKKSGEVYFINRKKDLNGNYSVYSYLFLKNQRSDSCYTILKRGLNTSSTPNTQEIDICFSRRKGDNFTTTTRFFINDSLSYNENIFYDKNYRIYRAAIRYNDTLYWYKIKR